MKKSVVILTAVVFIMMAVILSGGTVFAKGGGYKDCEKDCETAYKKCNEGTSKNHPRPECKKNKDTCINKCIKEWQRKDKDTPTGK